MTSTARPTGYRPMPYPRSEQQLCTHAAAVREELAAQDRAWGTKGWTRRRFIAGAGMVGAAAVGTQLVTSRVSYSAAASPTDKTLIVVFLRGAADGLRILQPATSALGVDYLNSVRPGLVLGAADQIALPNSGGWVINDSLKPLYDGLWSTGELAFVPAVSSTGISRSHFQAQQWLEKGGSDTAASGWLDRTLTAMGPGTTFRAVAEGSATPTSLAGDEQSLAMTAVSGFTFPGSASLKAASEQALLDLYRGVAGPLGEDVPATMSALGTAATIQAVPATGITYPSGSVGDAFKNLAAILKADVGMQVATVDIGGWDTHTDEVHDLDAALSGTATTLRAFMDDLGPTRRSRVTVAVMTEFGRRVAMNDSGGTDHGHGSVMWLLGGGLTGSGVYGKWTPLSANSVDGGDVPGVNNPFDVLGELVQKRLNVGALSSVFNGYLPAPLGLAKPS